jgi:ubiquitin C-terminal hydrolase
MGGVTFYLTWVSILMTYGHFCSMHLYGKDWYFYDDDSDRGLTRTDPEDIDYVNKENLKAFYLRN